MGGELDIMETVYISKLLKILRCQQKSHSAAIKSTIDSVIKTLEKESAA